MLSRVAVETARRVMTVFVVPGASRSVRVACRAISQADVAVLVVDPNPIELDESLGKNGRATEHLLLAHTYGIKDVSDNLMSLFFLLPDSIVRSWLWL